MRASILVSGTHMLCFLATAPALAQTARCSDGWVSYSPHIQGTCSGHGGVRVWLNEEMERQANEWCDNNPSLCANSHWVGMGGTAITPIQLGKSARSNIEAPKSTPPVSHCPPRPQCAIAAARSTRQAKSRPPALRSGIRAHRSSRQASLRSKSRARTRSPNHRLPAS